MTAGVSAALPESIITPVNQNLQLPRQFGAAEPHPQLFLNQLSVNRSELPAEHFGRRADHSTWTCQDAVDQSDRRACWSACLSWQVDVAMATAVKVRPDKIKGSGGLVSSCTAAGAKANSSIQEIMNHMGSTDGEWHKLRRCIATLDCGAVFLHRVPLLLYFSCMWTFMQTSWSRWNK